MLFDGKIIQDPKNAMLAKALRVEDIFIKNKKGEIIFKESGVLLNRESANSFLYDNGYGFLADFEKKEKTLGQLDSRMRDATTNDDLQLLVVDIMKNEASDSIQTWLANDTKVLNNFLGIDPNYARQDMLGVLGGIAILGYEFKARQQLANKLMEKTC